MPDDGVGEAHGLSHRGNQETKPQLSWEEAIHDIEQEIGTEDKRYAHAQRQQEWRNRFHEAGLQDMAQRMQWEIDLFELVGRPPWENEDPYFRPAAAYSDGSSWPQIDSFTDEMLDYVEERANVTQNPILKARYSDVIWERRKRHECARQAVGGYLAAANHYARLGWGIETAKAIARALELCLHLNDKELLAQPLSLLRSLLLRFTKADDPQRGLELADIALKLPSSAWAPSLDKTVRQYLGRAVRYYGSQTGNNPYLERTALEMCLALHRRSRQDARVTATLRSKAASFEREATDRERDSNVAAAALYGDAVGIYQQLGDRGKVDELQLRIRECNRKGASEFGVISTEIKIPTDDLERVISLYTERDTRDALALLSQSFIPNVDKVRGQTKELKEKTPLQFLLPIGTYSDGRLVGRALSDTDIFEQNVTRSLVLYHTLNAQIIADIIARLKERGMGPNELADFLLASPVLAAARKEVLERAIERYLAGDYISSIHIVVPELEHTIRSILPRLGQADTKVDRKTGVMRVKPLDDVLRTPKLRKGIGEDVCRYLYIVLVDQDGLNVRNDVAHGVMALERLNMTTATLLLHLLLILTQLQFVATGPNGSENETLAT